MRIVRIKVGKWRNLEGVEFAVPPEASLVCLVGENGTGKSNVMEMISALAHHLGIAHGIEIDRGNPLAEEHDFGLEFQAFGDLEQFLGEGAWASLSEDGRGWNGTITVESRQGADVTRRANGISDPNEAVRIAELAYQVYAQRQETSHLYLDADRSYPPTKVQPHEFAQALELAFGEPAFEKQWAFRPSRTLYGEWMKFMLAREEQVSTEFTRAIRRASREAAQPPSFEDPFQSFAASVASVLPHLAFAGVDTRKRTTLFDAAGDVLPFNSLSGGEREIAFLIGQIERFRLRRGLLLVDEPELHLNPDLLRVWLSFLKQTVTDGQVWIATHSLEAVEVAGGEATFVFERDQDTRVVKSVATVKDRPLLSAISAAVGSPAFSLSGMRFVFIEGERHLRERERFVQICGEPTANRFLEANNCNEVLKRLAMLKDLSKELKYPIVVGGVVDRDFRTEAEITEIEDQTGVHVLRCDEIENLFLFPEALVKLLQRIGREPSDALNIIRQASDVFAGIWILRHAQARSKGFPAPSSATRRRAASRSWSSIGADGSGFINDVTESFEELKESSDNLIRAALGGAHREYLEVRSTKDLWKRCLGKETLSRVPREVGLSGETFLEQQVLQLWSTGEVPWPEEATAVRDYVSSLSPTDTA